MAAKLSGMFPELPSRQIKTNRARVAIYLRNDADKNRGIRAPGDPARFIEPVDRARSGGALHRLPSLQARDSNRFWRRSEKSADDVRWRTTWRSRRYRGQTIRRSGWKNHGPRAGRSGHRSQKSLRHQRGETVQMGTARQNYE